MSWGANIANEVLRHTERELEAARSTIAELQKRIVELEAELKTNKLALEMCSNECNRLNESYSKQADALTAERKRLEHCEVVVKAMVEACEDCDADGVITIARVYFSRYSSESDNPATVAG